MRPGDARASFEHDSVDKRVGHDHSVDSGRSGTAYSSAYSPDNWRQIPAINQQLLDSVSTMARLTAYVIYATISTGGSIWSMSGTKI